MTKIKIQTNTESLSVEVINKKLKILVISTIYRIPHEETEPSDNFLRDLYWQSGKSIKLLCVTEDFNLNVFHYHTDGKYSF